MKKRRLAVDIETMTVPERSGYGIVIPNYAIVAVPDKPEDGISEFMYVLMGQTPQINKGLAVDGEGMAFWFEMCAKNYPGAMEAMLPSLTLQNSEGFIKRVGYEVERVSDGVNTGAWTPNQAIMIMQRGSDVYSVDTDIEAEIYGNGCNFDCSILQENHRVMYGNGNLWKYNAPQNARTLKGLLKEDERSDMDAVVKVQLQKFVDKYDKCLKQGYMELHHPLYDAAREALQISFCLSLKQS